MKKTIPSLHDSVFKQFLTHPDTPRDFLELHLPQTLLQSCDLNTLKLESGSFIESDLRAYYSDVLYSLKTSKGDGFVYALIEHQSSPDKHMAFRLVRYAIAEMQHHLEAGIDQLPLVIPILFYHGQVSPYPYSMSWLEEFSEPELAKQLYAGYFPLVDVTVIPDDEIMQHRRIAILELLQKHVRHRDLFELQERLVTLLLAGYTTKEQLISLINYMLQVGSTAEPDRLIRELAKRTPRHEEELMTIAEYLEQKGFENGLQKGIEQERETVLKIASAMLAKGFDQTMVMQLTGLSTEDLVRISQ
jgi:predicted transposase/invertase (TIGR01784 family)